MAGVAALSLVHGFAQLWIDGLLQRDVGDSKTGQRYRRGKATYCSGWLRHPSGG